jgi:hypothetical protein
MQHAPDEVLDPGSPSRRLCETAPFPFHDRPSRQARRPSTSWPLTTSSSRTSPSFLQDAQDVISFAKLPRRFGFAIEYTGSATNRRRSQID